MASSPSI